MHEREIDMAESEIVKVVGSITEVNETDFAATLYDRETNRIPEETVVIPIEEIPEKDRCKLEVYRGFTWVVGTDDDGNKVSDFTFAKTLSDFYNDPETVFDSIKRWIDRLTELTDKTSLEILQELAAQINPPVSRETIDQFGENPLRNLHLLMRALNKLSDETNTPPDQILEGLLESLKAKPASNREYLLVSYAEDFGRMGYLDGKILIPKDTWEIVDGHRWYASDVLGKHSQVKSDVGDPESWTIKPLTQEQAELLANVFDSELNELELFHPAEIYSRRTHISLAGFDPLSYLIEDDFKTEDTEETE
jgi:hypothetical protein